MSNTMAPGPAQINAYDRTNSLKYFLPHLSKIFGPINEIF